MDWKGFLVVGALVAALVSIPAASAAQQSTAVQPSNVDASSGSTRWGQPSGPWIAFAGSTANEMSGFVFEQSERLAERAALRMCEERGGGECEVEFNFELGCAAIVSGSDGSTWAIRPLSAEHAVRAAKRTCGADCEVVWSGCTTPRMRR